MSTDPYHAVQQEIQSSLQTAATLRASFLRIRSTAREDSEELVWARNEVRLSVLRFALCSVLVSEREVVWGVAEGDACEIGRAHV